MFVKLQVVKARILMVDLIAVINYSLLTLIVELVTK